MVVMILVLGIYLFTSFVETVLEGWIMNFMLLWSEVILIVYSLFRIVDFIISFSSVVEEIMRAVKKSKCFLNVKMYKNLRDK